MANCNMGEPPTLNDLVEWFSAAGKEVALRTVRDWVAKFGYYVDKMTAASGRKSTRRTSGKDHAATIAAMIAETIVLRSLPHWQRP